MKAPWFVYAFILHFSLLPIAWSQDDPPPFNKEDGDPNLIQSRWEKERRLPTVDQVWFHSPIFAMLQNDQSAGLQFILMPDFFGGNLERALNMWEVPSVRQELELTDRQLERIADLKRDSQQNLRLAVKDARRDGNNTFAQSPEYQSLRLQKLKDTHEEILKVLVPAQLDRLKSLERRSRLTQLGWEFVFRLMDRNPETRIDPTTRRKLDELIKEKRALIESQTKERFAKFLTDLEEFLDDTQLEVITRMLGDGKFVVRPTIEEMIWQLTTDKQLEFNIETDRFALLRRNKLLAIDGSIYGTPGAGGLNTGLLARDVILSAYAKIELEGDALDFVQQLSDPQGPYYDRMMKQFDEIKQAEERFQMGELSEQAMNQRIAESRIGFDDFLWKSVMGDLIPGLERQVKQHLVQLEIQSVGFPLALTQGHLARDVRLTAAQKQKLEKYYRVTQQQWKEETKRWNVELEEAIRELLPDTHVDFLRQELSAFDTDTVVFGTPTLVLLPRHFHF